MRRTCLLLLLLLLCGILPLPAARAATVCVTNAGTLAAALDLYDVQPDGSTLTIKMVKGTYAIGGALGAHHHTSYPRSVGLKLLGGYTAGCASRDLNPVNTVIDGLGQATAHLGVTVHGDAGILIEGVTFTRLVGADPYHAAISLGLDIGTSDTSTIEVRHSRFVANTARRIVYLAGAQMRFTNNLVVQNTVQPGVDSAAVYGWYTYDADSMVVATNNTIADNSGPGLQVSTSIHSDSGRVSEVADNILRGNAGADLVLTDFDTTANLLLVYFNMIGTTSGYAPDASNLASDPRFVDAAGGNYRLQSNSPAINSGAYFQTWGFPSHDIAGGARIVGSRIDRGAYESAINDATTAVVTTAGDNGSNASPLAGSLRAAIKAANAASGPFRITFNIPGGCPTLMTIAAPMPGITGDVTIDGTSQPGWTANSAFGQFDSNLCIYLNGTGSREFGLRVPAGAPASARLVVRGLGFAGFSDAAVRLEGGSNHRIWGSQFGAIPFTVANHDAIRVTGNSGGVFVGGYDDTGAVNLIAGSANVGIHLDNAAGGSTIANAVIGFQRDGLGVGGNAIGVHVFNSPDNVVQYAYIGHNSSHGVSLLGNGSHGNRVQYSYIGLDHAGGAAPNGGAGVLASFAAHHNTIGAPLNATWGGNFIDHNATAGVWISPSGGAGNRVLDNSFHGNGGVDIDLAQAGPSDNQPTNPGVGPNALQNWPVLTGATRSNAGGGVLAVTGSLHSAPNTTYRLDLYYGPACSSSAAGRGSALYPLMRTYVTTGALGEATIATSVPFGWTSLPPGTISATVTDPDGNTSEVGNCIAETSDDVIFADGFD